MLQETITAGVTNIKAIRAAGVLIQVEVDKFVEILNKSDYPVVVKAEDKIFFSKNYQYMTTYKGFVLYTETKLPIQLPEKVEIIEAGSLWLPS